jgi:hypothetical protein
MVAPAEVARNAERWRKTKAALQKDGGRAQPAAL